MFVGLVSEFHNNWNFSIADNNQSDDEDGDYENLPDIAGL